MSSMAGMATIILRRPMMGSGISSIAVQALTNTLQTRSTMWIVVVRRVNSSIPVGPLDSPRWRRAAPHWTTAEGLRDRPHRLAPPPMRISTIR